MRVFASLAALGPALVLWAAPGAAQTTRPQQNVAISPPVLLAPMPMMPATVPVLFQWTPVAAGTGYRLQIRNGSRAAAATTSVAVSYVLQISETRDFRAVLFERSVDFSTTLLFDNNNVLGSGFTSYQPEGVPLSGGRPYYWRVRAVFAGPTSAWSSPQPFTLNGAGITAPGFSDLALSAITVRTTPFEGVTMPLVVRVSNAGNTAWQTPTTVVVTANGTAIGRAPVPGLRIGEFADVSVQWTPSRGPLATILATIDAADRNAQNNTISQSVFVASVHPVTTTLPGRLVARNGGFALTDGRGRPIASVRARVGSSPDLAAAVDKRVELDGELSAAGSDLIMVVSAIRIVTPIPAQAR